MTRISCVTRALNTECHSLTSFYTIFKALVLFKDQWGRRTWMSIGPCVSVCSLSSWHFYLPFKWPFYLKTVFVWHPQSIWKRHCSIVTIKRQNLKKGLFSYLLPLPLFYFYFFYFCNTNVRTVTVWRLALLDTPAEYKADKVWKLQMDGWWVAARPMRKHSNQCLRNGR